MNGEEGDFTRRYHLRDRSKTRALIRSQAEAESDRDETPRAGVATSRYNPAQLSSTATTNSVGDFMHFRPVNSNIHPKPMSYTQSSITAPRLLPSSSRGTGHIVMNPLLSVPRVGIAPRHHHQQQPQQQQQQQFLYITPPRLQMHIPNNQSVQSGSLPAVRPVMSSTVAQQNVAGRQNLVAVGMPGHGNTGMPPALYTSGLSGSVAHHSNQNVGPNHIPNQYAAPLPIHPDVRFAPHAFYDLLSELHRTTTLLCQNLVSRGQEQTFTFHLSPVQAEKIGNNRRKNIVTNKVDYQVQVQLRFAKLIPNTDQEDAFPPLVTVKVNRNAVQLPPAIPTNKAGQDPKRPGRPLNITGQCRISPTVPNQVVVAWGHDNSQNYCAGLFLVAKLTPSDLIDRLLKKGVKPAEFSKSMMKEKMSSEDLEVAVTDLHASLLCPLAKCRMRTPLRASNCKHLQCFDAYSYLAMNEKKPTWKCPFCDGPAHYTELYIDGLFRDILEKASFGVEKIQFSQDGSWSPVDDSNSEQQTLGVASQGVSSSQSVPATSSTTTAATTERVDTPEEAITVDLTCSDDEDDLPSLTKETELSDVTDKLQSSATPAAAAVETAPVAAPPPPPATSSSPEIICLDDSDDDEDSHTSTPPPASSNSQNKRIIATDSDGMSEAPGGPPNKRPSINPSDLPLPEAEHSTVTPTIFSSTGGSLGPSLSCPAASGTSDNGRSSPRFGSDLPPPTSNSTRFSLGRLDWADV